MKHLYNIKKIALITIPAFIIAGGLTAKKALAINNAADLKNVFTNFSSFAGFRSSEPEMVALNIWGMVFSVALTGLGIVFLVYFFYAGYVLLTARGNEEKVEKSKKIISTCLMGILIVGISYLFTAFILEKVAEPFLLEYKQES